MASSFNELELLSQEDLIVETLRKLLATYHELGRREETTRNFFEKLCGLHPDTRVWFHLWESGGAHRFTDIRRSMGFTGPTLSASLRDLLEADLIRQINGMYQAVSPAWLVKISLPNRAKS